MGCSTSILTAQTNDTRDSIFTVTFKYSLNRNLGAGEVEKSIYLIVTSK